MYLLSLLRNKFLEKILALCITAAVFSVPASADVIIDTSLISFGFSVLTVEVDGEISNSLSDKYVYGDVVTLTAPDIDGKIFNYWANEEGKPISYNKELTLTIYSNTVLSAVYGTASVTPQPSTEFLSIFHSLGMFMFNVAATAPSGSTVTEYGIRYSTTKSSLEDLKGNDDVTVKTAYSNSNSNSLFDVVGSDDKVCYVVSYVKSGGQTYYSEVKAAELSNLRRGSFYVAGLVNIQKGISFDAIGGSPDVLRAALRENLLKVSFDANGGTGTMTPQGFLKDASSSITPVKFTRDYYTFVDWNTNANGSGTSYKDGASISLTQSIMLYAQWQPIKYTISYNLNGGTATNPTSYDVTTPTFKLTNPTKTGYTFAGWTGSADVAISKDVTIATGSTGNRSYTAIYTKIENPEEPEQRVLTKLNVILTADKEHITINEGSEGKIVFTPSVTAGYNDGTTANLMTGYTINWSLSPIISGITLANGILNISKTTTSGDYTVKVTAIVESEGVTGTAEKSVTVKVNKIVSTKSGSTTTSVTEHDTPTIVANGVETTPQAIVKMDNKQIEEIFGGGTLTLAGNMTKEELQEVIKKVTSVTTVMILDLSKVEGVEEVKIDTSANIETIIIAGNTSIKNVEVIGNNTIKILDVSGSSVETVDVSSCENLESVNIEGCESLVSLDVSQTNITSLNAQDCKNLASLNCASCDISDLNLEGCESLVDINCSNNSLTKLNADKFSKLNKLECKNQTVKGWKRSLVMSFTDFFKGLLFASDVDSDVDSDVANVDNLKAYDASNNEITVEYDKTTGKAEFSAIPEKFTYDYITGFNDIKMDVTVLSSGDNIGASNSGCNTGFEYVILFLIATYLCVFSSRKFSSKEN